MSRSFLLTIIMALLLLVPSGFASAQNDPSSLGTVRPSYVYEPTIIAIPAIERMPGTPPEVDTFARIIRRDLQLTGFFKLPPNEQQVNQMYAEDNRRGSVNFESWRGLGAVHLLLARVVPDGGSRLAAEVVLHDVESGTPIMSRRISGPADQVRQLAHKISDEVVRFTKNVDGFAQTQILFTTEHSPGVREVGLMDADAFNQRSMTRYGKLIASPVWGANGTEIFYTSYHGNRAIVYGQILGSNQTWPVAAYGGTNHSAAWCDANRRLVMVLSRDGNSELYSSARDGSELRRLSTTPATEGSPTWSPDGRRIAFVSNETGNPQIFVMNADGSGRRRLTTRGAWNDAPSWSPDGRRIAFVSRNAQINDVYIVNADGSPGSYKRLTMGQRNNESPSWAPNSTHICFTSDRTGTWQIYLMLDDGSNQVQLTTAGRNRQPAWGPIPGQ